MGQDRSLRRGLLAWRPGRVSLRVRLAATAVCLLAAGTGIIVGAGSLATRDHLISQARQQLRGYAGQLTRHPFLLTPLPRTADSVTELSDPGLAGAGVLIIEVRDSSGQLILRAATGRAGRGGSYLTVAEPIRYRAQRIPYAYSADDFTVDVSSTAGRGSAGTLVVRLSLARIGQATGRLTALVLAVSGLVVLAAGCLAAGMIRAMLRPLARLPAALTATLPQCPEASGPACGAGTAARQVSGQVIGWQRQAVADTTRELRTPLSVLAGLTEYYRHRDQLRPGDFDRLLARIAQETARMGPLIDALERAGTDEAAPPGPGPGENVGPGA